MKDFQDSTHARAELTLSSSPGLGHDISEFRGKLGCGTTLRIAEVI
jgi:hypothetical protein